ncbi:hypothetical protein SAMN05216215_106016 [Saccharopolyspora shandongensis]|uniref:Uncharacterized protein n=1 Tax=Saccharopolyspora shandongensis TaxID=418495 RepID=A0A1H3S4S1_9PSEU|nr:hypothetical protein [Saccharopolyspora shandongensis]SDZ32608.1 hypothetical protein SAMN05216215_106016 [Saccharopolyspora shandongensis]
MHVTTTKPGTGAPLWFSVPEQFQHIDLAEAPAERIKRTYDALTAVLLTATAEQRLDMVLRQEIMLSQLIGQGSIYVGNCLARSDASPSGISIAQLSIMLKDARLPTRRPLSVLASALREPGRAREVRVLEYPAGEALAIGEEVRLKLPAPLRGTAAASTHRVRQAQVFFLHPDGRHLVTLALSTEHVDDWPRFLGILGKVANSISFTEPQTNTISQRLAGT